MLEFTKVSCLTKPIKSDLCDICTRIKIGKWARKMKNLRIMIFLVFHLSYLRIFWYIYFFDFFGIFIDIFWFRDYFIHLEFGNSPNFLRQFELLKWFARLNQHQSTKFPDFDDHYFDRSERARITFNIHVYVCVGMFWNRCFLHLFAWFCPWFSANFWVKFHFSSPKCRIRLNTLLCKRKTLKSFHVMPIFHSSIFFQSKKKKKQRCPLWKPVTKTPGPHFSRSPGWSGTGPPTACLSEAKKQKL